MSMQMQQMQQMSMQKGCAILRAQKRVQGLPQDGLRAGSHQCQEGKTQGFGEVFVCE